MPKGYKEAYSQHDGAAHLGRDGGSKQTSYKGAKGRGIRIGSAAGVSAFNGASRSPDSPPRLQSGRTAGGLDALTSGSDAGGLDNMNAAGARKRSEVQRVPQSGSAKFKPEGVHAGDGVSAPKAAAKKPR